MRPEQSILAGLGAIAILLFTSINTPVVVIFAIGLSVACNVVGASLFHYGAAKKVYARKYWDLIIVEHPERLIVRGLSFFLLSILISLLWLSDVITIILLLNAILISFYARVLSKHWVSKNVVIAIVCTTPTLVGWIAGGMQNNWTLILISSIFFTYLAREIIKDVNDIEANHGIRVTLPIWLKSKQKAMYVAYTSLLFAVIFLFVLNSIFSASLITYTLFWLAIVQLLLIPIITKIKGTRVSPDAISISNVLMLASVVILIFV